MEQCMPLAIAFVVFTIGATAAFSLFLFLMFALASWFNDRLMQDEEDEE